MTTIDQHVGPDLDLADACAAWQGGRDTGSSLLRAGARALVGVPHYFVADFIADHDREARANPQALEQASILLAAVNASVARPADGWCAEVGLPATGFVGRGLAPKPGADEQILQTLTQTCRITMPLWGVSLDPGIAKSYGGTHPRWIFRDRRRVSSGSGLGGLRHQERGTGTDLRR